MKYLCMGLIRLYRRFISPLKPPACRFRPTCSAYALEAYRSWGFIIGTALTVWRILRCNPFCRPGYDPVPRRKQKCLPITRGLPPAKRNKKEWKNRHV